MRECYFDFHGEDGWLIVFLSSKISMMIFSVFTGTLHASLVSGRNRLHAYYLQII